MVHDQIDHTVQLQQVFILIDLHSHFLPGFLLLEEISFGVNDRVQHAEGLLRADGQAVVAAVEVVFWIVLKSWLNIR